MEEEKEELKKAYSIFSKTIEASGCRIFNSSPSQIFNLLLNPKKYNEWWPPNYIKTQKIEKISENGVGTVISFSSDIGNYKTTITKIIPNKEMETTYSGIFSGKVWWTIKQIDETKTELCYKTVMEPNTTKLKFFFNFIDENYAHSYYIPLFDSLEEHLNKNNFEKSHLPLNLENLF